MRPGLKKHNEVLTGKETESLPTLSWLIAEKDEGKLNEQAPEMHSSQVEVGHRRSDKAIEVVGRDMNKEVLENSDFHSGTAGEGLQKLTGNHDVDQLTGDNGASGPSKCSLKIEVIDGTALIDLSEVANQGYSKKTCLDVKHQKKRVREGLDYHKNEAPDNCERKGKVGKLMYTKKDMEAMRFLNVKEQKKLWQQICNGLEASVRKEYVELGSSRQQRNGHVDSRHTAAKRNNFHSVLGDSSPIVLNNGRGDDDHYANEDWIEDEDSDEDYSSIQRPAFVVEGEPDFDSGSPEDGFEYLRRVRWEAAQIPNVRVAKLDESKLSKDQSAYMPKLPDIEKCPEHLVPLKQWEDDFLVDFSELRTALITLDEFQKKETPVAETIFISQLNNCRSHVQTIEAKKSSPELRSDAPTLTVVLNMDPVTRISMLRKRICLLESKSELSRIDCAWLFALCAAVDSPLDADMCAALRSLLRKCAQLRAGKTELDDEIIMLNILATISGNYFGQSES